MKIFDKFFGKKVTVEFLDENGTPTQKIISKRQLDDWASSGKISQSETIQVEILDPMGSHTAKWTIGQDVPAEVAKQAKDPATGKLYALTVYKNGKPETFVTTKSNWQQAKAAMGE